MRREQPVGPTFPGLIFVGSGPRDEKAAQLLMAAVEAFFDPENLPMAGSYEGSLSEWIADLAYKPGTLHLSNTLREDPSLERTAFSESGEMLADPRSQVELDLTKIVEQISSSEAQEMSDALITGDPDRILQARTSFDAKLESKVGKVGDVAVAKIDAMKAQLMRMRALRAFCCCAVTANLHPLVLIAKARQGDRRAVLDLIKSDKLFLVDDCTRDVIKVASLRTDYAFLEQLGRALRFRSKMGSKKSCRLYLYFLFALGSEVPTLPVLQLRVDPEGKKFKTFGAFERFFERWLQGI